MLLHKWKKNKTNKTEKIIKYKHYDTVKIKT